MRMQERKANTAKAVNTKAMLRKHYGFKKPKDEIDQAIQAFLTGDTEGQFGRYWIHGEMLVYKTAVTDEMTVIRSHYGVDAKSEQAKALDVVNNLISRAERLEIDLVSHGLEQLREYAEALAGYSEVEHYRQIRTVKFRTVKANLIAKRINSTTYIGNSSVLGLIGRSVSFGKEQNNRTETDVQRRLAQYVPMIPFTVFHEAGLDLDKYKLVDRGTEETVTRKVDKYDSKTKKNIKVPETVHFTGSSLFEIDGHTYLFDIDRREITLGVFNPFLAEIPAAVKSIADAYEALKPVEVKDAEAKGLKVLRQGEWFFIPVEGEYEADLNPRYSPKDKASAWNQKYKTGRLQAGQNRPNDVSLFNESKQLFSGVVTHTGREHAPLKLKGWFKAIPNTATRSFTITGDID